VPFPKAEGLLSIGDFLSKVDPGTLATYLLNLLPTALRGLLVHGDVSLQVVSL
jgi:hypothetical protein